MLTVEQLLKLEEAGNPLAAVVVGGERRPLKLADIAQLWTICHENTELPDIQTLIAFANKEFYDLLAALEKSAKPIEDKAATQKKKSKTEPNASGRRRS